MLSHTQVVQRIWGDAPAHVFRRGKKKPIDVTDAFAIKSLGKKILDEMAYAKADCHIRIFSFCRKRAAEYKPPTHEDLRAILPLISISRGYEIDPMDVDHLEKYFTQGDGWICLSKPAENLPTICKISYV